MGRCSPPRSASPRWPSRAPRRTRRAGHPRWRSWWRSLAPRKHRASTSCSSTCTTRTRSLTGSGSVARVHARHREPHDERAHVRRRRGDGGGHRDLLADGLGGHRRGHGVPLAGHVVAEDVVRERREADLDGGADRGGGDLDLRDEVRGVPAQLDRSAGREDRVVEWLGHRSQLLTLESVTPRALGPGSPTSGTRAVDRTDTGPRLLRSIIRPTALAVVAVQAMTSCRDSWSRSARPAPPPTPAPTGCVRRCSGRCDRRTALRRPRHRHDRAQLVLTDVDQLSDITDRPEQRRGSDRSTGPRSPPATSGTSSSSSSVRPPALPPPAGRRLHRLRGTGRNVLGTSAQIGGCLIDGLGLSPVVEPRAYERTQPTRSMLPAPHGCASGRRDRARSAATSPASSASTAAPRRSRCPSPGATRAATRNVRPARRRRRRPGDPGQSRVTTSAGLGGVATPSRRHATRVRHRPIRENHTETDVPVGGTPNVA